MNDQVVSYLLEIDMTPGTLSVIQTLVEMRGFIPKRYLDEYSEQIQEALESGYVAENDDHIYLTKKSALMLKTIQVLDE